MAITFTWSVKDMHRVNSTGAVYRVDWICVGLDADSKVTHNRSGQYIHTELDSKTGFNKKATPDHTASGFKTYADLTEADVLGWVKGNGEGDRIEALITKSINSKIANHNASSTGMPWAAE
tara:strand:+ start:484 stop:846 length:363 start_codon:yes stop_codon:yes gene_type:complete